MPALQRYWWAARAGGGRKWAPRVEPVATVIIIIVRIYTLGVPKKVVNRILRAVVHPLLQATFGNETYETYYLLLITTQDQANAV